jgi:hypothetical protein
MAVFRAKFAAPVALACTLICGVLAGLGAVAAVAATPEPTPEQVKFFEEKVRPILAENCYKCHGSEKQKGKLRLDLREGALAGGEDGPVIVPGKPEESVLIEAVKWQSFEMPPNGKLNDLQIATLTEWIRLGAPMPKDHGDAGGVSIRKTRGVITDADRQWWAFQPIRRPALPSIQNPKFKIQNAIDAFLVSRMQAEGLSPAPEADKLTLIRRSTFDLVGLPPTPTEIDDFLTDDRPDAYERIVDRLLASPHYGEHWGRHWLDLVRYAESDGYKQDAYRSNAFHYRDYVIRAFNTDKPYSRFILEQLAGDEVAPTDPEALFATGYLRVGIYEYNQRDVKGQWTNILNDLTDVTSDVFLGMGMSCARCHDHKFDPILQKDYYRLQAFLAPIKWRDDVPAAPAQEIADYERRLAEWNANTAELRAKLDEIERPMREAAVGVALKKFPVEMHAVFAKAEGERTPLEKQWVALAFLQLEGEEAKVDYAKKLKGEVKQRWEELHKELVKLEAEKPTIPTTPTVTDVGPVAPVVLIPGKRDTDPIEPGPLSVLDPQPLSVQPSPSTQTTARRTALAQWLTSPENPLPARVLANRLWQYHFGRGLCEAPSDFGRLGQPPTHPELLDWLASELVDGDWQMKSLHRQMVTSAAYRQASHGPEVASSASKDPANKWLSRMTVRRLAAEQIRDAAMVTSGEIDPRMGGEGSEWNWTTRRAVYLKVFRNKQDAALDVFDAPDGIFTTPVRNVTTTPTQSLFMINGPWMMLRAKAFAQRISADPSATLEERVAAAYRFAFGRAPTATETKSAVQFQLTNPAQSTDALVDMCHVLLNSNEFLYVD